MDALTISVYRLTLRARESVELPAEKGTMLRGGFGVALKRSVCAFSEAMLRDCSTCPVRSSCAFPRLFEGVPPSLEAVPPRDLPRPFVFRIPFDRRISYQEGDTLDVEFALIGWARDYLPYVTLALSNLAKGGIGRQRGRFDASALWSLDPLGRPPLRLDQDPGETPPYVVDGHALAQRAATLPANGLTVTFLTPTRLVSDHRPIIRPTFYDLIAALRRRAEDLCRFHCGADWRPNHDLLAAAARSVRPVAERLRWLERSRRSTRSDVRMPMGGIVGQIGYEGDLRPFRTLLALGEIVHVGKYAAFGNGQLICSAIPPSAPVITNSPTPDH